jgi:hypothetical protein
MGLMIALVVVVAPVDARAQCGSGFLGRVAVGVNYPTTVAAFTGTVVAVKDAGRVIIFEVDRVFKGDVSKTATVYGQTRFRECEPLFPVVVGKRYFVTAQAPSMTDRDEFGIGASDFVFTSVGDLPIELVDLQGLEEGRAPR